MAEETKVQEPASSNETPATEEKKESLSSGTLLKYLAGILFILGGLALWIFWWGDFLTILKGGLGPLLVLVGVIFIAIAKE